MKGALRLVYVVLGSLLLVYLSVSKLTFATVALLCVKPIIHRLVETTERDEEGLVFHIMLQSAHIWPIKK